MIWQSLPPGTAPSLLSRRTYRITFSAAVLYLENALIVSALQRVFVAH